MIQSPTFKIPIGPLEITGYGLMVMVGFLIAGWVIDRDLRRRGLSPDYAGDTVLAALIGGIVGAKLWFAALHGWDTLFDRGGLVWYGGLLGGALMVVLNGWRLKVPFRWNAQLVGGPIAAAYALGRIGCFMVGDDYGVPASVPWAVAFPQGLPPTTAAGMATLGWEAPAGTDPTALFAVHPTQLYEAVLMTGVFMLLWAWGRRADWGTGALFGVYLAFAGLERFLIEFVRLKDDRLLGAFTLAQATSVALLLIGVAVFLRLRGAGQVAPGAYLSAGKTGTTGRTGKPGGN